MSWRVARVRRALAVALLLTTTAALGACSVADRTHLAADATLTTASVEAPAETRIADAVKDDVTLGKEHFRAQNYGLAELHFRRAVEDAGGDAEAWLGLAAAYDQLKRFELADRAYRQVLKLTGPTPELLNNRGYSYLLRGDLRRASQDLAAAAAMDPDNDYVRNNLKALDGRARRRRG